MLLSPQAHLPAWLSERTRVINPGSPEPTLSRQPDGFVLYWMHHAIRDNHNPALDVARLIADSLKLPVLVYQGLNGKHPYNNDRHHTFILEGARDVQQALRARGISYALSLGTGAGEPGPLISLARRASLVISEDFPAPPFPRWIEALARSTAAPVWLVDTACVVPMQSVDSAFARAYEFRQALTERYKAAMATPYPSYAGIDDREFTQCLGFDSVDLSRHDIAELCAMSDIDHSVAPAPHTVGGMTEASRRWRQFKQHKLAQYAERRNDADLHPDGVSRLSPYLHHGHISAFELAHDCWQLNCSGAKKFADELLIWRELAHNFCFHQGLATLETLSALPSWAQATLSEHAGDCRPMLYDDEQLTLAATHDALWNTCQQSLLIHGELHNNLRMTWGKALLAWSPSPANALDRLIALNHRFALDGGDPNSYGGLLWCLGLFDRPFKPEQPVSGSVRTRSLEAHQRRLNMPELTRHISRYRGLPAPKAVILGGGTDALAAARTLHNNGMDVQVLDCGPGQAGSDTSMAGPASHLITGLEVLQTTTITSVHRAHRQWHIKTGADDQVIKPDYLIIAMPAAQARRFGDDIDQVLATGSVCDPDRRLVICADCREAGNIENACSSGVAAAARLLAWDRAELQSASARA